jgi:hypothetical protein
VVRHPKFDFDRQTALAILAAGLPSFVRPFHLAFSFPCSHPQPPAPRRIHFGPTDPRSRGHHCRPVRCLPPDSEQHRCGLGVAAIPVSI